jgi:hypothetical protein
MDEAKIWNAAITAFEKCLETYYKTQSAPMYPLSIAYHVQQIANDLRRDEYATVSDKAKQS